MTSKIAVITVIVGALLGGIFVLATKKAQTETTQEITFSIAQQSFVKKVLTEQKAYNERANQTISGAIQQIMDLTPDPDTGKPPLDAKKWQTAPTEDGGFKCVRAKEQSPTPQTIPIPQAPEGK